MTTIATNRYGKYCVPNSKSKVRRAVCETILAGKVWEPDTIEYIINNCKGELIHAGTYFGDFLPALKNILHVWAFEPNTENFYCANQTIELNNLTNITLQPFGLGNTNSACELTIARDDSSLGGSSTFTNQKQGKRSTTKVMTQIVTLDSIIPSTRKIDMIQLDVELYELQALQGAVKILQRDNPTLILEMFEGHDVELRQFLKEQGYSEVCKLHDNTVWKKR